MTSKKTSSAHGKVALGSQPGSDIFQLGDRAIYGQEREPVFTCGLQGQKVQERWRWSSRHCRDAKALRVQARAVSEMEEKESVHCFLVLPRNKHTYLTGPHALFVISSCFVLCCGRILSDMSAPGGKEGERTKVASSSAAARYCTAKKTLSGTVALQPKEPAYQVGLDLPLDSVISGKRQHNGAGA